VFGEDRGRLLVYLVGDVLGLGEEGHGVGERERGAFVLAEQARFRQAPGR
jgi:hypothetical protein